MSLTTNPMRRPRKPPLEEPKPTENPQPSPPPASGVRDPAAETPTDRNWPPPRSGGTLLFLLVPVLPLMLAGAACTAPGLMLQRETQVTVRGAQAKPADPRAKPCLDAAKAAERLLHQSYPVVTRAADDGVFHMRELCRDLVQGTRAPVPPTDGGSRAPVPPADGGSRAPVPPADGGSRAPVPPTDGGSHHG